MTDWAPDGVADATDRDGHTAAGQTLHLNLDVPRPGGAAAVEQSGNDLALSSVPYRRISRFELATTLGMRTDEVSRLLGQVDRARTLLREITPYVDSADASVATAGQLVEAAAPMLGQVAAAVEATAEQRALTTVVRPALPAIGSVAGSSFAGALPYLMPTADLRRVEVLASTVSTQVNSLRASPAMELFRERNRCQLTSGLNLVVPMSLWEGIRDLFRNWRHRAGRLGPDRLLAAEAHAAALELRATILSDPESEAAVIDFGRTWLGFASMPRSRVDATVAALLDDSWFTEPAGTDFTGRLRELVDREHTGHRPITERQIGGLLVTSLDEPALWTPGAASPLAMRDLIAAPDETEAVVLGRIGGWEDPRIERVLARLNDRERAVAVAYAEGGHDMTWDMAAARVGVDTKFATRVQTKLKREGRTLRERLAAARTVTR